MFGVRIVDVMRLDPKVHSTTKTAATAKLHRRRNAEVSASTAKAATLLTTLLTTADGLWLADGSRFRR